MSEYICEYYNQQDGSYPFKELPGPIEMFGAKRERLIRCHGCKYYREKIWVVKEDTWMGAEASDICVARKVAIEVNPDGFCSLAEPKEDA